MPVVVKVADERRGDAGVEHPLLDFGHRRRGIGHVHRDAHHFRACFRQLDALLRRAARIGGVGHRHRLHDDRRAAANLNGTDFHADGPVELHQLHGRSHGSIPRQALATKARKHETLIFFFVLSRFRGR